jgi:hypothetical protein
LLLGASTTFVANTLEVRPDPLMNLCLFAGLLLWAGFLERPRPSRALAAGACFGLAVAVLQKALVPVGLALGAGAVLPLLDRRAGAARVPRLVGAALAFVAAAAPVGALFVAMRRAGLWADFWFWNYPFNRYFYLEASLARHFSVLRTLGPSVAEDPLLWIAGLTGAGLRLGALWRDRRAPGPRDGAHAVLLVVLAGYLVFLLRNRFPLEQYYLVLLPLVALYSAELYARLTDGRRALALRAATAAMAALLALQLARQPDWAQFARVQDYVLAHTRADETVFVPPEFNPIFRVDAAYFWYNATLLRRTYATYCVDHPCPDRKDVVDDRAWDRRPPAYVYLCDPDYTTLRWPERAAAYVPTEIPSLLERRDRSPVRGQREVGGHWSSP